MTKLKCTNPKTYKLTLNGEYEILDQSEEMVTIVNDSGKKVNYAKSLFTAVAATPPPPPPPPVRTEQDCIDSIEIYGNDIRFVDLEENTISINAAMYLRSNNDFSCGVVRLEGLNSLMERIEETVDTSEEDLILLKQEIFIKAIIWNSRRSPYRFALLSTNNNDAYEDYFETLDSLSHCATQWAVNPNSGNDIKIWTLLIE
jgi:hypothetical protein